MIDPRLPGKRLRGFAAISPERRAEIASMGGKAAHESGRAHQFTPAEAREAGKKGAERRRLNRMAQETAPLEIPVKK